MFTVLKPRRPASRWMVAGAVVLLAASAGVTAAKKSAYGGLVVFGTSLSDPGNAFVLLRDGGRPLQGTPPDYAGMDTATLVPNAPYARGGHHLSNGATWIEHLARSMGLAASAQSAFRSEGSKAANYAVAAARTAVTGQSIDLPLQVHAFLQDVNFAAPSDALYVIEMGGNDVRDALVAGGDLAMLSSAANAIATHITLLYGFGARNFLVWYVPDVGLTPSVRVLGPAARFAATAATVALNQLLEARLVELEMGLPGIDIVRFDAFSRIRAIAANPTAFGLRVVDRACVTPNVPPFACRNAHEYLFWDGVHPTTAGHALIAEAAAAALGR